MYYKEFEKIKFKWVYPPLSLSPEIIRLHYLNILERNKSKQNNTTNQITHILQKEKVSLRSKIKDICKELLKRIVFKFSDMFSLSEKSKLEVITGFLAILELSKLKKVKITQKKLFSDILVYKNNINENMLDEGKIC